MCRIDFRIKRAETRRECRVVTKESAWPIPLDELSRGLVLKKIVNENGARLTGAQQLQSQFERAEFLRPVNQNSVAALQSGREDIARIAVEKIDIRVLLQLRFGDGRMFGVTIKLNADDVRFRKAAGQCERALTTHSARFQNLFRSKWTHRREKKEHSARADAFKFNLARHVRDGAAILGQQLIRAMQYRGNAQYLIVTRVRHHRLAGYVPILRELESVLAQKKILVRGWQLKRP